MVQTVEVGAYNLPDNVLHDTASVVGKYAAADLAAGDYILPSKHLQRACRRKLIPLQSGRDQAGHECYDQELRHRPFRQAQIRRHRLGTCRGLSGEQ